MHRAVFLDRDGVVNRKAPEGQYIVRWEDFEFLPGVPEGIRHLNEANFSVVVVSNQRCTAKGLITSHQLEHIHRCMIDELAAANAIIDAVYYCPHEVESQCACRKPAPGMLVRAAQEHSLDLNASWMVGDSDLDILAGKAAGCRTVRILRPETAALVASDLIADSLLEAAVKILSS